MHYSPIERADAVGPEIEVRDDRTYLQWLAQRRGVEIPANAHYGPEGIKAGYGGPIILAMPGYGQSNVVEVEELDEAGGVIRSCRIGLKSNGALPWVQKKVRDLVGPVAKPPKAKAKAKRAPTATGGIEQATPIGGMERQGLAEQVTALAGQVAAVQAQLAALSRSAAVEPARDAPDPIGGIEPWDDTRQLAEMRKSAERPASERKVRERIVRAYLRVRAQRDEARKRYDTERMIAADRMATIWRVQDARKATIRMAMAMRQRRALDVSALEAGRAAYLAMEQRATKAEQREQVLMMDAERLAATVADLRAKPHHFGNPVPLDALGRVQRDRDAARLSLASAIEERDRLARAVVRGATALEEMTDRAFRAEIALRAVEARRERERSASYRVNCKGVIFGVAA